MDIRRRTAFVTSLLCAVLCLPGRPAAGQAWDRAIDPAGARADVALARRALSEIHPGLGRYGPASECLSRLDRLEQRCAQPIGEREFFAELSLALASIRCSHTKAEPSPEWQAWRGASASYFPFRVALDAGRLIVTAAATSLVQPGDEVLSIDGVGASTISGTILDAVPADGWTDGARRYALGAMSDLDDSEFDHFYPFFFAQGAETRLEVRSPGEASSREVVAPLVTRAARAASLPGPSPESNLDESVSLEVRDGVGVMRIGTFVAYRKQIDPEDVYRPLFQRLRDEGVSALIIDLRDNGGGSDEAVVDLLRFLVAEPFRPETRTWVKTFRFGDLADRIETWDRSVLQMPAEMFKKLDNGYYELLGEEPPEITPLEPRFKGRLIALCGPANASGATLCLAALDRWCGATLIGEETGGSVEGPTAGVILFLKLPASGIRVRIPALRSVTGLAAAPGAAGGGVVPDIEVSTSVRDAVGGRDPVLEAALRLAGGESKGAEATK